MVEFQAIRQTLTTNPILAIPDFQLRAWQALCEIPYGATRSYSEQAQMIEHTNGLNPISIIVPCHRVIAKSGKLASYAGGLAAKAYLLALEAKI